MTVAVWREPVQDAWIDYNGHLSEPYYVLVFGHATDAVMDELGLGPEYRSAHDASLYTVEAHVRYLAEVAAGSELEVRSSVIGATAKFRGGSSAPFPDEIAARARDSCTAPPEHASGRIRPLDDPRKNPSNNSSNPRGA